MMTNIKKRIYFMLCLQFAEMEVGEMLLFFSTLFNETKKQNQKSQNLIFPKNCEQEKNFEVLYQKFHSGIYERVCSLCHDSNDAQDIMQETWMCVVNYMEKLEGKEDHVIECFIMRAAYHRIQHFWREQSKDEVCMSYDLDELEMIDDADLFAQCESSGYQTVVECLKLLSVAQRDVLNLYYLHDFSLKEIAKLLHLSKEATASRWCRGRRRLIELLRERGIHDE